MRSADRHARRLYVGRDSYPTGRRVGRWPASRAVTGLAPAGSSTGPGPAPGPRGPGTSPSAWAKGSATECSMFPTPPSPTHRCWSSCTAAADRHGVILVAPDSRDEQTWDLIVDRRFGPDVAFLDRVLEGLGTRIRTDMRRLALGGVSDGASYALSVGLSNGDVFETVLAFSPGFIVVPEPVGRPRVFVSHGTHDPILPIDACSRAFVPALRGAGYDVWFEEFDGGHRVPPPVADLSMRWWLEAPGSQDGRSPGS